MTVESHPTATRPRRRRLRATDDGRRARRRQVDDGRREPLPVGVRDDQRDAAVHRGNQRMRGAEVDADDSAHGVMVKCSVFSIQYSNTFTLACVEGREYVWRMASAAAIQVTA